MPRFKITLEYDGLGYHGWQKQSSHPSIQSVLEERASKIAKEPIRVIGAGRTDAGVHAQGQVAHFDTRSRMTPIMWQKAFNRILPDDIAVLKIEKVSKLFHARHSAISKCYQYAILNRSISSPLNRHQSWVLYTPLSLSKMRTGAKIVLGTHDFKKFRSSACTSKRTVLTLERLEIKKKGDFIRMQFEARSFLMHMIRHLVGYLVAIGQGKINLKDLNKIFQSRDLFKTQTAPPFGLCLLKVNYPK